MIRSTDAACCPTPHALAGGEATARPVRWMLATAGIGCVAMGALGVVVPGLPTTIFLIVASWCFARSCPWLERKLIRNRFFKPFLWALDTSAPMPRRGQVISTILMWAAIALSGTLILSRASDSMVGPAVIVGVIIAAGAVGTWCIWWVAGRRRPAPAASSSTEASAVAAAA